MAISASCWIFSAGCAATDRLVFICLHPTAQFQINIMKEICERFLFVNKGGVDHHATFAELARQPDVHQYLGALAN